MQKEHLHLVKYALNAGHCISVFDGGEWAVKRSTKPKEIIDAMESVDECVVFIKDADGKTMGWAMCVFDYGQAPDEIVADHTITPFMDEWQTAYREGR